MSAFRAGIIGTGAMGSRMVAQVQKAGDPIIGYDRDADRLADGRLIPAASVGELVADVDVVLMSLPDSTIIERGGRDRRSGGRRPTTRDRHRDHEERSCQMKINHGREARMSSDRRGPNFTGEEWAEPPADRPAGGDGQHHLLPAGRAHPLAHPRDRPDPARHPRPRLSAINEAGEGGPILPGDVVWIDAGERHWHGGGPDSYLTHIAISLGEADWQDAVTDEQYRAAGT